VPQWNPAIARGTTQLCKCKEVWYGRKGKGKGARSKYCVGNCACAASGRKECGYRRDRSLLMISARATYDGGHFSDRYGCCCALWPAGCTNRLLQRGANGDHFRCGARRRHPRDGGHPLPSQGCGAS